MSSSRQSAWERVDSVLDRVLDSNLDPSRPLTEEDRARIAQLCDGDVELETDVLELLSEMQTTGDPLDTPLDALLPGLLAEVDSDHSGRPVARTIDRYRLVEVLGRGGMGVVYRAERADDQFDKQVALKLMPAGLESPERERRFLQERQILARLEHPGIARLLDGGMTAEGYPYLVMELVEGETIERYCDDRGLSIRERVELFLDVCEAVRYAHRNLVVHRDLKPGNCLVTSEGRVQLLDFGIAKILEADGEDQRTLVQPMTPHYAAPEQLAQRPISTASDVYSLGVLLYRLLVGVTPFELDRHEPTALREAVLHRDPPLASERHHGVARRPDDTGTGLERRRRERQLRGDLDVILAKALRRDPDERYASVAELDQDLRRYLDGHPISARRISTWARAGKFAARHRTGVVAAALVLAVLAAGVAAVAWQGRVAARERDRARVEERRAQRVARFVTGLLEAGSVDARGSGERTARELLDEAESRIWGELEDQPVVRASLLDVMARSYLSISDYDSAERLVEDGLRDLALSTEDDSATRARLETTRASVALARGELEGLETVFERVLDTYRQQDLAQSVDAARAHRMFGQLLARTDRHELALEHHRAALEIFELRDAPTDVAIALTDVGARLESLGRAAEGLELKRDALERLTEIFGADHPHAAATRNNIAVSLSRQGRYEEAEALYREALASAEEVLGMHHPRLGSQLTNLARALVDQRRFEEAAPFARRAYAISRASRGPQHVYRIAAQMNLASVELELGNVSTARELYRDGLEHLIRTTGDDSDVTARARSLLARALAREGRRAEAVRLFTQALERQRQNDVQELHLADTLIGLGSLYADTGRCERAEPLLEEARSLRASLLPPGHWKIGQAQAAGSSCHLEEGRPLPPETSP